MNPPDLIEELASFSSDPAGFVLFAFPWGEESGELASAKGPEGWQWEVLEDIRLGLLTPSEAIRLAVTSGHGIGKSALVSWIILWSLATYEDTKGVVTANTETQLKTKTWAEVSKWFRLFIGRDLFHLTATAIFSRDPEHSRTWRIDMVPWSERNTEAFAGLHNKGKRILVVFDEGSAIPDAIYEVTEGALTDEDTQIIWALFGNPTLNKGRFRECFDGGRFAHRWKTRAVDSRSVSLTNKTLIEEWLKDWGEDHDFFRVRVRGVFPREDAQSFISLETARLAASREVEPQLGFPVVIGVDVARFGGDSTVLFPRQGRDARSRPAEIYQRLDTMAIAAKIQIAMVKYSAIYAFVDDGGVGGGVVDRLRQLRIPVVPVNFSSAPAKTNLVDPLTRYANKRAEIWGAMKAWLEDGAIDANIRTISASGEFSITLLDELVAPTYAFNGKEEIQLEKKSDMKRRGAPSPNIADALACTFAWPDYELEGSLEDLAFTPPQYPDYNPFERIH